MHSAAGDGNSGHLQEVTSLLATNTHQVTLPFQSARLLTCHSGDWAVCVIVVSFIVYLMVFSEVHNLYIVKLGKC